ncbi:enduracididine biosynthesis enzyme MppR [Rhodococcus sp. WS3]|uniref:acetoacetate decarboxylase family protein n=1 Tax=Rhodococcus sp. WS3 TaxID=2486271 RepID=UPI001143EBFE|nr:acetoacetate decarboxylase family protein [Rhodococcus sp. WS3]ROZ49013.1 enduracididine biosynthesis enzyme MppR [Rhodococcus sp. WS3]
MSDQLKGWTLPLSPTGRSALVPPPPWHFSGEALAVDFTVDPERAAMYFPDGLVASPDGAASIVFARWSSAADADPGLAEDPTRGQYNEAYIVLHGARNGRPIGRCPFIWVDSDLSLVRGLIQGFPKRLGKIDLTTAVQVGRGGPRRAQGERFAGHASSLGATVARARVTLDRAELPDVRPPAVSLPLIHSRLWPAYGGPGDRPAISELVRSEIVDFELADVFSGPAELEIGTLLHEEIADLTPTTVGRGWVLSIGFTINGGRQVR